MDLKFEGVYRLYISLVLDFVIKYNSTSLYMAELVQSESYWK